MDEPAIRLKPISFDEIEGWAADDHAAALAALQRSCRKKFAGNAACKDALALGDNPGREAARRFFEANYVPHRFEGVPPGLVTGYYEPEVSGSREKSETFHVPVYARPDDIVQVTPDVLRARYNDRLSVMRKSGEELVPYYTRAEIDSGALEGRGLELLYLDDPVELFFMQIQGSGRVRLPDGSWVRLGYAAKNGHSYTSIGRLLAERGEKAPGGLTMDGLKWWLRADPKRGQALMHENASYVFFRELPQGEAGEGPVGAQGVPLTPGRSLAVDASYHALGTPVFVTAPDLAAGGAPFRRLMVAQDVGSAIKGLQRGDIFFGTGDEAGALAGTTKHKARFYVLLPKD
ncbi:MAG: murein transglycosylase A [Methyloceanibacter sp.]|uniref:murein transglycosylase A n=1 Tax=Methyloceanibacter sp. TaxID=1965321 RepID=UPI003D6C9860